tara:strand:- start:383 stop:829 length:447 start_codon:yes stop_codon:yes gene_type:complete
MSEVFKICIANKSGLSMQEKNLIDVIANKGILDDRYFLDSNNDQDVQITLIESENIDYYNKISETNIPYIDFRRNIITKNIELNNLVGKNFIIGNVKLFGHRLCDPCKYLQDIIGDQKLVKRLINRGGLRCEAISSGKISLNDPIEII